MLFADENYILLFFILSILRRLLLFFNLSSIHFSILLRALLLASHYISPVLKARARHKDRIRG
jgi:hypothetical protein